MGKKSAYKAIKKLADEMPPLKTTQIVGEKRFAVPVNHVRKMKQLYQKYGAEGVQAYAAQVNLQIAKSVKKAK